MQLYQHFSYKIASENVCLMTKLLTVYDTASLLQVASHCCITKYPNNMCDHVDYFNEFSKLNCIRTERKLFPSVNFVTVSAQKFTR